MVGNKRPVGKSVQTTIVKQDSTATFKKELDNLRVELMAQLAAILGEVKAAQILGYTQTTTAAKEKDDTPVFIPETIINDDGVDAEINIETEESNSDGLDDAAEILRKMKQKSKK